MESVHMYMMFVLHDMWLVNQDIFDLRKKNVSFGIIYWRDETATTPDITFFDNLKSMFFVQ